ncbi:MAG TPA: F0F1 ATP synthase subunit A [Bryobacteraceae bacterium]|jgi:F-type H+-transporting ATPase subunit a
MQESELWITRIFNDRFSDLGNAALQLVGMHPQARPWANYILMQFLVFLVLVVVVAILRARLSAAKPGKMQQTFELLYGFVRGQAEGQMGQEGARYVAFFGTIFIFILVSNLLGLIPAFESPTMNAPVTLGCAMATFFYYNLMGVQAHGFKYILQFMGPKWWLAFLMFPIEIVSHLARPLSLTIRLYANMFAGEQVTMVFLNLTYLVVPVIFMGLHIFVGVVQAYIFMLLAMSYVGGSIAHEH